MTTAPRPAAPVASVWVAGMSATRRAPRAMATALPSVYTQAQSAILWSWGTMGGTRRPSWCWRRWRDPVGRPHKRRPPGDALEGRERP